MTSIQMIYHLPQKIAIVKNHHGSKEPSKEEKETHAQVENSVQVFSFPYFPYKSTIGDDIQENQNPFEQIYNI